MFHPQQSYPLSHSLTTHLPPNISTAPPLVPTSLDSLHRRLAKQSKSILEQVYLSLQATTPIYENEFTNNPNRVKLNIPKTFLVSITNSKQRADLSTIVVVAPTQDEAEHKADFKAYWDEVQTCNYSDLLRWLMERQYIETQYLPKELILFSPPTPTLLPTPILIPPTLPYPLLPITLPPTTHNERTTKPPVSEPLAIGGSPRGYILTCKACKGHLCNSELLFSSKDRGIHSYRDEALSNLTIKAHHDNAVNRKKISKLHCSHCDASIGNIMEHVGNKNIFNFKKVRVLLKHVESSKLLSSDEWVKLGSPITRKRHHEGLVPSAKIPCTIPLVEAQVDSTLKYHSGDWLIYKLGLYKAQANYAHPRGHNFSDFIVFSATPIFCKSFSVSRPIDSCPPESNHSEEISPKLLWKLRLSESQFQELVTLSDMFVNAIPNLPVNSSRNTSIYVLPFVTHTTLSFDVASYFIYVNSILRNIPACDIINSHISTACDKHNVKLNAELVRYYSTHSENGSSNEELAATEAMKAIESAFCGRLMISMKQKPLRIATSVNFAKRVTSPTNQFPDKNFVDYYKDKDIDIKDETQPIIVSVQEFDDRGPLLFEFLPELVQLSGVTSEMYYAGLFLKETLERLNKSSRELNDLYVFQQTIGFNIKDLDLLKKVFTGKSAADSDRQQDADYEIEEFLGDSVLEFVLAYYVFLKWDTATEGELSSMQGRYKTNKYLQCVGKKLQFQDKSKVEDSQISDVVEAFIGGLFIEQGLKVAADFIMKHIVEDKESYDLFRPFKIPPAYNNVVKPQPQKETAMVILQHSLRYYFKSKELLIQALTHGTAITPSSFVGPIPYTYQRLEFLGDAIFKFICGAHCYYLRKKSDSSGELHDMREKMIGGKVQVKMAELVGVNSALLIQEGHTSEKDPRGDAMEAIVGAVFLETGIDPQFKGCLKDTTTPVGGLLYRLIAGLNIA